MFKLFDGFSIVLNPQKTKLFIHFSIKTAILTYVHKTSFYWKMNEKTGLLMAQNNGKTIEKFENALKTNDFSMNKFQTFLTFLTFLTF